MKSFIKISFLLLLPFFAEAQEQTSQQQKDSLRHALRIASTDASRFKIARSIAFAYLENNRDSALHYFEMAMPFAEKNNKTLNVASALSGKGYQLFHIGRYGEALQCLLRGVKIAENPANENKIFELPEDVDFKENRLNILAQLHLNLAFLMNAMQDTAQTMFHYKESKRIAEEAGNDELLANVNVNLGGLYIGLGKLDSALLFEQAALALFQKNGMKGNAGSAYRRIGQIYQKKGDTKKAVENWHLASYWYLKRNNQTNLAVTYGFLSSLYQDERSKDSSLYYARKQLSVKKLAGWNDMGPAYSNLYKSFELNGNIDSAYIYKGLALQATEKSLEDKVTNLVAFQNEAFKEQERLQQLEQEKIEAKNKLRNYSLLVVLGVFLIIGLLLYRNNRQKRKANALLQRQKDEINDQRQQLQVSLENLKSTQAQLIQSEKMASLGELTAGIAHEIQNPLNFVNNFSEVSSELLDEMNEELEKGDIYEAKFIANDIKQNLDKINHHGKRADAIVKGMLEHSRTSSGDKVPTDINALAEEYLRLSYHGMRAKDKSFNADFVTDFDPTLPNINLVPQEIGRVLLNIINNAFQACIGKDLPGFVGDDKRNLEGLSPLVKVTTKNLGDKIEITISDNGPGIPDAIKDKIFQPFFTTKPTGQGTGLGLSLSYDIVKAHGGELKVETKEGEGSEFILKLPIS
ncbi:ATP-binding protein [Cognataquiflexum rubidum]|uniref:ATP-binding protein n=1 Tax=Cognataquiflexum rubidum TaxID=2922273 RepID=UPI001F12A0B4|nr:ATP-binding protein [Cognataquiflexum rubidum]MCH6235776.1 ATP-binding protein [Cognataquiflexum rubidum]